MSLYKTLLGKGKEAIAAMELPFKVKKEQKQLEMKILELENEISKDELTIQENKSASPVDWNKLIKCIDDKALNDRKLAQLKALEKEMFLDEA